MNLPPIDWSELFSFSMHPVETLVRGSLMFWFLFLVFRFILRRDVGALRLGDFLFVAIVADASQNAMSADAKTIADGMLLVSSLVFWNYLMDFLSYYFPATRRFLESTSLVLVKDGKFMLKNMRREMITKEEIFTKLREEGMEKLEDVKEVRLEKDGEISVLEKK
ncbi:DUF421 domain-containing protein [soil metagenome]